MGKNADSSKTLIEQSLHLLALGMKVEHKRSIVKRPAEISLQPTMEMFRAIDEFNIAKMEFEKLEKEHITLRNQIADKQK